MRMAGQLAYTQKGFAMRALAGSLIFWMAIVAGTEASCPSCRPGRPCQKCCPKKPCAPPQQAPPQQAPPQAPPGYFAAPPQSGPVAGESQSVGVEGFAIHFPAMSLKLPTLQLPSVFRMRHNPRMMLEQSNAPFVQAPAQLYS